MNTQETIETFATCGNAFVGQEDGKRVDNLGQHIQYHERFKLTTTSLGGGRAESKDCLSNKWQGALKVFFGKVQWEKQFKLVAKNVCSHLVFGKGRLAQQILRQLEQADGFLPFTDKSDPHAIREQFGISKKLFKKSLGSLYRQRLVQLKVDGIYLTKNS